MVAAVLAIGLLLRVTQYWACRSLWLDEASLALNFFDGGFQKMMSPFDNHQAAPVGFNLLSAGMVRLAGLSEWSLRFLPLVAGIAAVFVFWRLSRRWLRGGALVFTNYAFAISSSLVYYSNEFKPYILDVLLGLVLLSSVLAWWEDGKPRARLVWLAVTGVVAVWFSFPIVFVMAGVGGAVLLACLRERTMPSLPGFVAVVAAWLVAFGCQYVFFAQHVAAMDDLTNYWREEGAFMPFPPWERSHGGITWFTGSFFDYFHAVAGLHHSRNILQFIFLCGVAELVRRRALLRLGALLGPIGFALVASAMERYPFQGRLVLFTVPFALLICGAGMEALLERLRRPVLCCALVGIALFSPSAYSLPLLWRPAKVEEVRPLAAFLQREAGAQDVIFVFKDNSSFALYARLLGLRQTTVPFAEQDVAATLPRIAQELAGGRRCWLVISHVTAAERATVFAEMNRVSRPRLVSQQVGAELLALEPLAKSDLPADF